MNCSGGASDEPPCDTSENSTSSFLKSVDLNHPSTPLAKRTTVTSSSGSWRRSLMAAGSGSRASSAAVDAVSFHAVTSTFSALATAARSSASVGTTRPCFCGEVARMTRLGLAKRSLAAAVMSAAVMPGSSACTSLRS